MIPDPYGAENINGTVKQILEPLSKMTESNKKQYIADVKVMNYLLKAIPNDIYISVDASKEGESLESVYEILTMLVNIMDRNNLPVETPENPFVEPVNIETIEVFMNKVGYQGVVDKVNAFYTKNLAQPWQTISILQIFHAVINHTNVDYAALLWWDFMNNVQQKKEAIQYLRFIKLILADLMNKFPEIPKRIEEDYYSIKDDIPLVSVYR
ncbi:hypothetical protein Tco_0040407 [Tanacetum coccineum]